MSEERFPEEPFDEAGFSHGDAGPEGELPLPPPEALQKWLAERGSEPENAAPRKLYEKEVKVVAVYEQVTISGQKMYFVLLRDNHNREIRIYVGAPEAMSISMVAEGQAFSRPLTHDLMKLIVDRTGWKVDRVTIDDLYNETFYAKLTLTHNGTTIDIDCRPSDAIALAMRAKAPIYVAEDVITSASKADEDSDTRPE
jgi:bifunctional DNase/RNase